MQATTLAAAPVPAPVQQPVVADTPAPVSLVMVPTVDPALVQVAAATQTAQSNTEAMIHVIVYGAGAQAALASMSSPDTVALPLINAGPGSVPASRLGDLGLASGVTYVAVDSPVKPNDSNSNANSGDTLDTSVDGVASFSSYGVTADGFLLSSSQTR